MKTPTIYVLVVDDSNDDRQMYALFLAQKGFRVSEASDGAQAVRMATGLLPTLIVMDLWLPVLGGWEASRQLRADKRTMHIPIVVLTARSFVTAEALGCEGCLIKPCPPEKLYGEILRVLGAPQPVIQKVRLSDTAAPTS